MNNSNATPISSYFGIVSPCSICQNQRSEPDPISGLPSCPRRAAMELQSQLASAGLSTVQVDPLVLTGNEDNPNTTNTGLVNPVYSTALNSVLVWIATIVDNKSQTDSNGNLINPGLLDPNFDTNYIVCREKPITPSDTEAAYRSNGAWNESDQLLIHISESQQTTQDSDNVDVPILLNGFASKVNFSYSAPRVPVDRDYTVSGT